MSGGEGDIDHRKEELSNEARYRIRSADFISGISVASLIALVGLVYAVFRNFSTDINRVVESFQSQVSRQIDKLDDRVRELERRRR